MLRRPCDLVASDFPIRHRSEVAHYADVEPLVNLCAAGKLYEVEDWISQEKPIQFAPPQDPKLQKKCKTPLQIAVESGFHSLAALLLANGYDPNGA